VTGFGFGSKNNIKMTGILYHNDPTEYRGEEIDNECCPHCGSDRIEYQYSERNIDIFRCKSCDEYFEIE